ncbi:MAG: DoxX family protein [Beijerinckiaceae bacterium]
MSGRLSRWLLAAFIGVAGALHIVLPAPFLAVMPDIVPWPEAVVLTTGLCELAGAVGLLTSRWRRPAGLLLALYAICVFPANLVHARQAMDAGWPGMSLWYHAFRLPLQPLIVLWALAAGGWIGTPQARRFSRMT